MLLPPVKLDLKCISLSFTAAIIPVIATSSDYYEMINLIIIIIIIIIIFINCNWVV